MPSGPKAPKSAFNNYLKYTGLGLQLLLTIGVAGWLGYKLDEYLSIKFPAFMLLFGFMAFAGTLYQLYKAVKKQE